MEGVAQGLQTHAAGGASGAFFFFLLFVLLQWSGGAEYFFTTLVISAALVSIIDPVYFWLARHRALYFGFHAGALFVALLVLLPLIFHWRRTRTYLGRLADRAVCVTQLLALWAVKWFRWAGLIAVSCVIARPAGWRCWSRH